MQMIGRILRPWKNEKTGYMKQEALFFDHVNLVIEHQESAYPNIPLHYVPEIKWNFEGTEKRKRNKDKNNLRCCPNLDYMYCDKPTCSGCQHNPGNKADIRKPIVVIDTDLKEIVKPLKLNERPPEERREYQDRINQAIVDYGNGELEKAVADMILMSVEFGYGIMWVYWRLTSKESKLVNVPLLYEMERQKGYKKGWAYFKQKDVRNKLNVKQKEIDEFMGVSI